MKLKKFSGSKVISAVMTGVMVLSFSACDFGEEESYVHIPDMTTTTKEVEYRTGEVNPMQMSVNKETGEMSIMRPDYPGDPMGDPGTWTILVYVCGSDLESDGGAAVADISEMCEAESDKNIKFVVQTGGAQSWTYDGIDPNKCQRFLVEDGNLSCVYESADVNMADSNSLADFLTWGIQNYPADNMGLIFWNHGNGTIYGVCFDERHDQDSLSLRELDSALLTASQYMSEKWEFIGFDACLMGNVEAANILANYAYYMYASEEEEPGAGWNYTEIGNYLVENPEANGEELGMVVCDSYYDGCVAEGDSDCCTLSVIDLMQIDSVLSSFNIFAKGIYESSVDADKLSTMIRKIESSETFGSNNDEEGYTNMIDLVGLCDACGSYSTNIEDVISAVDSAVIYKVSGTDHPDACGLSLYFPINLNGSNELQIFSDVCISPFYLSFIERRDFSAYIYYSDESGFDTEQASSFYQDTENGCSYFMQDGQYYYYDANEETYYLYDEEFDYWEDVDDDSLDYEQYEYYSSDHFGSSYSDDYYYDDDGLWFWNSDYDYDSSSCVYRNKSTVTDHYNYADNFEETGESKHIKFLKAPSLNEEGTFSFTLTKYSLDHTSDVYAMVYMVMGENEVILLGDTYDVECDWTKGNFADCFDGYWISLPDGQNLSMTIVYTTSDYVIFSAPVCLNGEDTYLRIRLDIEEGTVTVEGACDGLDESGAAPRNIKKIKEGDKIVPLYTSLVFDEEGNFTEQLYEGQAYTVSGELQLSYSLLFEGDFMYAFIIEDVYRDYLMTDLVEFNVDLEGNVSYYVDGETEDEEEDEEDYEEDED